MFYWLATWLEALGGPALFRFLTSRSLFAFVTAFLLGLWVGRPIITWLYRKGLRSEERKYQALDTGSKKGTPVMGGLILLASGLGSALAWCDLSNPRIWVLIFAAIWFALVGGYDDYAKVRGGSAEAGMSRPVKLICQLGFGLALGFYIVWPAITPFPVEFAARFYVPFRQDALVDLAQVHLLPDLSLAWLYLLGSAVVIGYSTNAVNFTDGLDGLTTVPCLLA
ncbi:MAG: hypothetical protein QGG40_10965 [Myxococcota bacterium]|nr:hypothetical protein [Myxococcota bacterium]